jgi:hypothetical protein
MKKEQLIYLMNKNPSLEVEAYTLKDELRTYHSVEALRTDNCDFLRFLSIEEVELLQDNDILDCGLVTAEDYNSTIYAGCRNIQEEDVIVAIVKQTILKKQY